MSEGAFAAKRLVVDAIDPDPAVIREVAGMIKRGLVVALPTDTVYGVAADVFNRAAVDSIYEVKGRPPKMPLPVLIADPSDLGEIAAEIPEAARLLADRFWPGPLTIILPKADRVPDAVTAGGQTVGVRCPDNRVARAVIREVGVPLATTSANVSGEPPPTDADGVLAQLGGRLPLVLDAGPSPIGVASTIVDLTKHPAEVIREGSIKAAELKKYMSLKAES
ncbi:MAG: L-threonylcarbamoyladenylate synthase [Candidatus Aquicultorales bacterium]